MLGNCDKMVAIPPTTNQWPQSQIDDDHKVSMGSSGRVMEKPGEELLQQQQEALKCPRCNSSNTKFCYYNNYSLSQPRHFCKACKRYWTRGGTLRNVPVGGGCRKNKRVKRPTTSSAIDTIVSSSSASCCPSSAPSAPSSQPQIDIASTSNHNNINPLLYGYPCDVNFPFPSFNSRISSSGYDLQPQLNALALGFSSGINGFTSNNTLLSSHSSTSIFSSSSTSTTSTTPVLLSSTLLRQKFINGAGGVKEYGPGSNILQGLTPLEQLQMASNSSEAGMMSSKDVKVGGGQNRRLEWNGASACQNQMMEHVGLSDPSLYWNTATAMAAWNDQPNNIGSSVTFLI